MGKNLKVRSTRHRLIVINQKTQRNKKKEQRLQKKDRRQKLESRYLSDVRYHQNCQQIFNQIMRNYVNISKNTNSPKFMLKFFIRNYQGISNRLCDKTDAYQIELHKKFVNKVKKFLRHLKAGPKKFDQLGLKNFKQLFGKENGDNQKLNQLSRRIFSECLRRNYNSIINKTRVMSLKEYMITMKIQMIRCRHPDLAIRIQVKI